MFRFRHENGPGSNQDSRRVLSVEVAFLDANVVSRIDLSGVSEALILFVYVVTRLPNARV